MSSRPQWPFGDHRRKQSYDFRSQPLPPSVQPRPRWTRRPLFIIIFPLLLVVLLLFHYHNSPWNTSLPAHHESLPLPLTAPVPPPLRRYHPLRFLRGPPTELFRGMALSH